MHLKGSPVVFFCMLLGNSLWDRQVLSFSDQEIELITNNNLVLNCGKFSKDYVKVW